MSVMLSGWGRYPQHESRLVKAFSFDDVATTLALDSSGLIACGGGRAYGDAAIGHGTTLSTTNLDYMRAFDPASSRLTVEAGVRLSDIVDTFLPRGFFPHVVPGTKHVTVGGMIAADIHGKNHWRDGGFGSHVEALTLALPDGAIVTCSSQENADLFQATIGGMGLTGVILEATFRMAAVETAWILQTTTVAQGIDQAVETLSEARHSTYAIAWLDAAASGKAFGRSLVFAGSRATRADLTSLNPSAPPFPVTGRRPPSMPVDWPLWPKSLPIRAFNELYFRRCAARAGTAFLVDFDRYFFPLDAIANWNRMFARHGLVQHQCVIPESARSVLPEIFHRFRRLKAKPVMAVLKRLGDGSGILSFPKPGYTLAVDIPMADEVPPLLDEIDRIVVQAGGRLYLAKDSRQSRATFEAGYEGLDAFRALRRRIGAEGRLVSRLASRLAF